MVVAGELCCLSGTSDLLLGCLVKYGSASSPPSALAYACPCMKGLQCVPTGVYEVPLGQRGNYNKFRNMRINLIIRESYYILFNKVGIP